MEKNEWERKGGSAGMFDHVHECIDLCSESIDQNSHTYETRQVFSCYCRGEY